MPKRPRQTDEELAAELDRRRVRFFTLESAKRTAHEEQLEAIREEQEALTDRIAAIYRTQKRRARLRAEHGIPPPRESPDDAGL
jgi:hypothetical protein